MNTHNDGTGRAKRLYEASVRERRALSEGKSEDEAMVDAGLILDTPINEHEFLEKKGKNDNGTKRVLMD